MAQSTSWPRPSWLRLSMASAVCGVLAGAMTGLLLAPHVSPSSVSGGLWLVDVLLGLVAIGTAVATFILPKRNRSIDVPLAVLGLVAGGPGVLIEGWILLMVTGGGGE
jgi:hypothetical protein